MAKSNVSEPISAGIDLVRLDQLDGLRGLAILGVLANHFLAFPGSFYCGWLGVNLFFVLSGFLITRILLEQKKTMSAERGVLLSLGIFYARRALRIFPLYYLTLAILWTCNFEQSRRFGWWLATYTYNIRLAMVGFGETYDHFWSLCVEEQFYLIWPAVALTLSPRKLAKFLMAAFLAGPAWRLGCLCLGGHTRFPLYAATFACLDCLAAGSLLAYFKSEGIGWQSFLNRCRVIGLVLMILWVVVCNLQRPWMWHHVAVEWIFGNTAMAIFFAWVVGRAVERRDGDWNALIRMRWLTYLGAISYGVYVLHNFAPLVWTWLGLQIPVVAIPAPYAHVALAICAATLSWNLIERPIQRLKKLIPYAPLPPRNINKNLQVRHRAA